jgi:hypothetical protein
MTSQRFSMSRRPAILIAAAIAGMLGAPIGVRAQAIKDLQTPSTPLVLKAQRRALDEMAERKCDAD